MESYKLFLRFTKSQKSCSPDYCSIHWSVIVSGPISRNKKVVIDSIPGRAFSLFPRTKFLFILLLLLQATASSVSAMKYILYIQRGSVNGFTISFVCLRRLFDAPPGCCVPPVHADACHRSTPRVTQGSSHVIPIGGNPRIILPSPIDTPATPTNIPASLSVTIAVTLSSSMHTPT